MGTFNPGFSSPTLDSMIKAQAEAFGDAQRLIHYDIVMRAAMEEMPLFPLFTRTYLFGLSERVVWQPRLDGELRAVEMSLNP